MMSGVRETVQRATTVLRARGSVVQVLRSIGETSSKFGREPPRLVAVSKTQPLEKIKLAYMQGLCHFGENYVQELHGKADLLKLTGGNRYADIKWHFIGNVQTNKVKKLLDTPCLWMVETVHKRKTAKTLNDGWGLTSPGEDSSRNKLKVLIQVNTSKEKGKQGCLPEELLELASYITEDCQHLQLCGLMTVGTSNVQLAAARSQPRAAEPGETCTSPSCPNTLDFSCLVQCRKSLANHIAAQHLTELSMGMSADYHHAIEAGSTNVRIGTAVFGPRECKSSSTDSRAPNYSC